MSLCPSRWGHVGNNLAFWCKPRNLAFKLRRTYNSCGALKLAAGLMPAAANNQDSDAKNSTALPCRQVRKLSPKPQSSDTSLHIHYNLCYHHSKTNILWNLKLLKKPRLIQYRSVFCMRRLLLGGVSCHLVSYYTKSSSGKWLFWAYLTTTTHSKIEILQYISFSFFS